MKFRSKTIIVEAVQLRWSNWSEVCKLAGVGTFEEGKPTGVYVDEAGNITDDANAQLGLLIPASMLLYPPGGEAVGVVACENEWIIRMQNGVLDILDDVLTEFEPLEERESAEFTPEWTKYPKLARGLPVYGRELSALLVEARADAAQYIRCVNAEELDRARVEERKRFSGLPEVILPKRPPSSQPLKPVYRTSREDAVSIRDLTDAELLQALENVGCHLDRCDACAEVFFTGSAMHAHSCGRLRG